MSIKSYKYRFYPTPEQEVMLAKTFGCVRYVYNRALKLRSSTYRETGRDIGFAEMSRNLTQWKRDDETAWLKDVAAVPLQQATRHLYAALDSFFCKRSNPPKPKRRRGAQSATYAGKAVGWSHGHQPLRLAKLGSLDVRWSRRFSSEPSSATITKTPSGKYFVSLVVDEENREEPESTAEIGVDLGIKSLAVTSDGEVIENPRFAARYAKKLSRAQRILSRRKKGSNRWHRARVRVAKIHEAVVNSRLDWTHKATTKLIRENQAIYVEDLSVSNMVKNRRLSKAIADCSWYEFTRQLKYKAEWYGRTFAKIDRFAPTSKTCSSCGHRMREMPLKVREWRCPECGDQHDRDVNAAKNILAAGRAVTGRGGSVSREAASAVDCSSRGSVKQAEVPIG